MLNISKKNCKISFDTNVKINLLSTHSKKKV